MPRVKLLRAAGAEPVLFKVAAETPWADVLDAARLRLGYASGVSVSVFVCGARVTSVDDLDEGDELIVVAADAPAATPPPMCPQPATPPSLAAVAAAAEAAKHAKKAAKKQRQREAKLQAAAAAPQATSAHALASHAASPPAASSPHAVVALDAANIGHCDGGSRAFDWSRVAVAIEYYAARGVRAVPVTKRGTLLANPLPDAMVNTVAGDVPFASVILPNVVAHDDANPEADDIACAAFAREHSCSFVTNDGFASAMRRAAPELRRWMEQHQAALHVRFAFLDGRFVPYQTASAAVATSAAAQPLAADEEEEEEEELEDVVVRYRTFAPAVAPEQAPLSDVHEVVVSGECYAHGTVYDLQHALLLQEDADVASDDEVEDAELSARVHIYGGDGAPFTDGSAFLSLALVGAAEGTAPEVLHVLLLPRGTVAVPPTSRWARQASNFGAAAYGVGGAGGGPKQAPAAVSTLASALLVAHEVYASTADKVEAALAAASNAGMWPPALLALRLLLERSGEPLAPQHAVALLAGFTAAAVAQAPQEQLARNDHLVAAAPTLLTHWFSRQLPPVHQRAPLTRVSLADAAGKRISQAVKLEGGTGALYDVADLPEDQVVYADEECVRVTRLVARAGPAVEGVMQLRQTWIISGERAAGGPPARLPGGVAAVAALAAGCFGVVPPLDLKNRRAGACLTLDATATTVAFLRMSKSDDGCSVELWRPLRGADEIANINDIARELAKRAEAQQQPRRPQPQQQQPQQQQQPAPAARSRVTEAVVVILDVSGSMAGTAYHPPPPPADGAAGSTCTSVFLGGLRAVHAAVVAAAGARASPAAVEAAMRARLSSLCDAVAGVQPRTISLHNHPETRVFRGSCHLKFASPAAAEAAVLSLDGVTPPDSRDRLVAELSPEAPSGGGSRGRDRLSLMKAALCEFAEHTLALDLPHAGGLLLCGTEVTPACALTPSFALFWERAQKAVSAARGGATRLYDALAHAAELLKAFAAAHPDCNCRVLALTDGEDTSGASPAAALAALRDARVTLDAVLLSGRAGMLAALAADTGGVVLQPASEAEALSAFQREAFLSLHARQRAGMHAAAASSQATSDAALRTLARELGARGVAAAARAARSGGLGLRGSALHAEDDAAALNVRAGGLALSLRADGDSLSPSRLTDELRARVRTPAAAVRVLPALPPPRTERQRRLQAELRALQQHGMHEDMELYVSDSDLFSWHLLLTAPEGLELLYDGGAWRVLVDFPDAYPDAPPAVYFVTPIVHVNVSRDGRVCHALLGREYHPGKALHALLPELLGSLLAAPAPEDPLNKELAALFYADAAAGGLARYELAVRRGVAEYASQPPAVIRAQILAAGAEGVAPAQHAGGGGGAVVG